MNDTIRDRRRRRFDAGTLLDRPEPDVDETAEPTDRNAMIRGRRPAPARPPAGSSETAEELQARLARPRRGSSDA